MPDNQMDHRSLFVPESSPFHPIDGPRATCLSQPDLTRDGIQLGHYQSVLSPEYQAIQRSAYSRLKPGVNASNQLARGVAWGVYVNGEIIWQERNSYSLPAELNPEEGGRIRLFELLDPTFLQHPVTVATLKDIWATWDFSESTYEAIYQVQVSGIRYEPTLTTPAMPSPVIPHQDAVDGVILCLSKTPHLTGGHSRIYDLNRNPLWEVRMEPGDALYVRDAAVLHQVAPVLLDPGPRWVGQPCYRDVLLVRFQRVGR